LLLKTEKETLQEKLSEISNQLAVTGDEKEKFEKLSEKLEKEKTEVEEKSKEQENKINELLKLQEVYCFSNHVASFLSLIKAEFVLLHICGCVKAHTSSLRRR